jgi:hypothetical protein
MNSIKKYFTRMRIVALGAAILLLVTGILPLAAKTAQASQVSAPPAGYRKLKDLHIFSSIREAQWAGAGNGTTLTTETPAGTTNPMLPLDSTATGMLNGLPSLVIEGTGTNTGWWAAVLAGHDWETFTLKNYITNGKLEFNVKGSVGGERMLIGFDDRVYERTPENDSIQVSSSSYVTTTTAWQHVVIPLTALIKSTNDLDQTFTLKLNNDGNPIIKMWLNDIKITDVDNEAGFPAIKVNLLGFTPNAEKYALVSGFQEDIPTITAGTAFQVKNTSGTVVASGTLALVSDYDTQSGERVFKADFSSLATAGTYHVSVAGLTDSPNFQIGAGIYSPLLRDAVRYFYLQRQGIAIQAPNETTYTRGVGMTGDANAQFESGCCTPRNIMKGWFDAGDYGKYVNAGGVAVSDMLWAYELYPSIFTDSQFNIPESGNGVPDILDEIKWETDWMLTMQDSTSGGFWARVQSSTDDQQGTSDVYTGVRWIKDKNGSATNVRPTAVAGIAAGSLAEASIIFRPFNSAYADTLLAAAQKGWDYLVATPGYVAVPPGPYEDTNDANDRFYAAAALYRATGLAKYNDYVVAHYTDAEYATFYNDPNANGYFWDNMSPIGFLDYVKSASPNATVVSWWTTHFNTWRNTVLTRSQNGTWRNNLTDTGFFWGSNMPVLNGAKLLMAGARILGENGAAEAKSARAALNYILGENPMAYGMVSGYGARSTHRIFSNQYSHDGKAGIPPGYIPGGPNNQNQTWYSNFAGKSYLDSNGNWTSNENAIYWNSALVFSAALEVGEASTSNLTPTPTSTGPTPTKTITPTPSKTFTPSNTPTITQTPTATNTAVPGLSIKIQKAGSDDTQQTGFNLQISNTGSGSLSNLSWRLYFNTENGNAASTYILEKFFDQSGVATISGPTLACGSTSYYTVSYGTTPLATGSSWSYNTAFHINGYPTTYDGVNDWWHSGYAIGALPAAFTAQTTIPGYINGALGWGSEPTCGTITSTPTRTPTVTSPPVITNTPTQTVGASPTRTFTPTIPPVITNTPTRTFTPPAITNTPTLTSPPVITNTPTRTFTPTIPPVITNTPTRTFTPTTGPTATATPTTGGACTPTSTITVPFVFDGPGTFCWQASALGSFINNWNNNSVTLNGVNITNIFVASGSYPAKIGGFYYINYNGGAFGHFETKP